jgi:hypothetical protein
MGRLAEKPFLGGREQFREMVLQAGDGPEPQVPNIVQKGGQWRRSRR